MDAFPSTLLVSLYRLSSPFSMADIACRLQDLPLLVLDCKSKILLPIRNLVRISSPCNWWTNPAFLSALLLLFTDLIILRC